jgi:hypothetical protein
LSIVDLPAASKINNQKSQIKNLSFTYYVQKPLDDGVGVQAFAGGGEVENDPVPQYRQDIRADVVAGDVEPPVEDDVGFGGQDERLPGSRPAAEADVLAHQIRRFIRLGDRKSVV